MTRAERERMLQAGFYFAHETQDCTAKKMFKLLYLLDVLHFQATGRSVTGMQYTAHTIGPSPDDFAAELRSPKPDMASLLKVETVVEGDKMRHLIRPAVGRAERQDLEVFSGRQLDLLKRVSERYRDLPYEQIDVSLVDNGAWASAFTVGKGHPIELGESIADGDVTRDYKLGVAADYEVRSSYLRALA